MKKLSALILVFITCYNVIGQDRWNQFNTLNTGDNGLVDGYIYCFLNDSHNTLWIGTASGISRYDGSSWSTITSLDGLVVDEVGDMALDNNNNIWISYGSSVAGVSMYDGTNYTHFKKNDGLLDDKVNDIMVDSDGNIWFACGYSNTGGICMYNGNSWTTYSTEKGLPETSVQCIAQDKNGDVLIGTSGKGTYILQNDTIIPFCWQTNSTDYINDIHIDNSGNIWVAGNQAYKYDGTWSTFYPFESGKFGRIYNIKVDESGRVLFSTSAGFTVLDGSAYTYYDTDCGLPHNAVYSSFVKNDSIWIGNKGGIAVLVNNDLTVYTTNDNGLISNDVNSVFEDDSANLWFCTQSGISKYNGSTWQNYNYTQDGKEIKWVSGGIMDKDRNLWFGTVNGIFKYDHSTWEVYDYNVDDIFKGWIQDIIQDSVGNLWFAGMNYLIKYDGTSWTHYNDTCGFQTNYIDALHLDSKGRIWAGNREGISVYDGSTFTHYLNGVDFNTITPIHSIFEDKEGQVYAISEYNILTYINEKWETLPFSGQRLKNGMCDNSNQIWLSSTSGGVIKFNLFNGQSYTVDNGMNSNNVNSVFRTKEGLIYVCTDQGITEVIPEIEVGEPAIEMVDTANHIYNLKVESLGITKPYWFSIDGEEYVKNDGEYDNLQNLSQDLYITNIYDTIQINYCVNTYSAISVNSSEPHTSPSNNYIWTTSGTYYDTIPNSIGCDSIITVELNYPSSNLELELSDVEIYPNPTTGKVIISLDYSYASIRTDVFNQTGQKVYSKEFLDKDRIELDLKGANGLYYIKIISKTGAIGVVKVLKN